MTSQGIAGYGLGAVVDTVGLGSTIDQGVVRRVISIDNVRFILE